MTFSISIEAQKFLLFTARNSIRRKLNISELDSSISYSDDLSVNLGAFVTLHKRGRLRGCIGFLEGVAPLIDTIEHLAQQSAFSDNRFNPVTIDEVDELEVEITILSHLIPAIADDIVIGRDGLIVTYGSNRGVLLSQVATENKWDKYQFISHTCQKAGLDSNIWKKADITIERFESIIFNENLHNMK